MEDKEKKVEPTSSPEYSLEQLKNDVLAQYDAEEQADSEEMKRDKFLKLKVLNHLLNIVLEVKDTNEEDKYEVIRMKLADDEALFAYTCFLASNAQFDYSWNYQRKQWDNYIKILGSISAFFTKMISCINTLQTKNCSIDNEKFVFANLFMIALDNTTGKTKVKVIWENIEQLFHVQKGYSISAQFNQVILLSAFCRYKGNDLEKFFENLSKLKFIFSTNV